MSILDEGENLFDHHESKLSYDYLTAAKNVDGRVSMIHIVKCACNERIDAANCSRCIGHKYNTKHGCPVCGATWVAYPFEKIYQCNTCGSVIIPCGFGDVIAVGVIDEAFRIEEGGHYMSSVDSYEHTEGSNPHATYFSGDVHREYDCYELPCNECEECRRAISRGDIFMVCPACGTALRDTNIQYACECGCVIEPCTMHDSKPFVAGFASQNILSRAIEAQEDMI